MVYSAASKMFYFVDLHQIYRIVMYVGQLFISCYFGFYLFPLSNKIEQMTVISCYLFLYYILNEFILIEPGF